MINTDEDALICDMAETYQVYDWRSLPVRTAATLASGLREDSRIRTVLRGDRISTSMMLSALTVDGINKLCWFKTEDGQKNRNRPPSILELLNTEQKKSDVSGYDTVEEFEAQRRAFFNGN